MSTPFAGKGTAFNRWDGSQWVAIGNINSISGPSASRSTIDVTTLDSPGGYRKFIAGLKDGGELTLNMNFILATYLLMKDDFEDDATQQYSIVLPDDDSTTLVLEGLVTGLPTDIPLDDKVTCNVTIKLSGETSVSSILKIVSLATISNIPVANGTQLSAVGLPSTVTATLSDATTASINVAWNAGTPVYNGALAGTYVFSGTLAPGTGKYNPQGLKAAVSVVVAS